MRKLIVLGLLAGLALAALFAIPAGAKPPGANGRIVFSRFDPAVGDTFTYTVNPDGSHVQQLFSAHPSNTPHWSPDGSEVAIFCCDDGMAAHFVNPDTGSFREVAPRSEEHTSELQSRPHLVCRLLLEKKKDSRKVGSRSPSTKLRAEMS